MSDLAVDKKGSFYVQGGDKGTQIVVFDATGKSVTSIGSGMLTRNYGRIRADRHGLPRFAGEHLHSHLGQSSRADESTPPTARPSSSTTASFTSPIRGTVAELGMNGVLLAVAPEDRVWAAATSLTDPTRNQLPQVPFPSPPSPAPTPTSSPRARPVSATIRP